MFGTLDLPTVLFLLKTSYLSGGCALAYVRWRSPHATGAGAVAMSYLALAIASTVAGYAEIDHPDYALLSLIGFTLGTAGFALFLVGAFEMSARRSFPALRAVHLAPLVVLLLGLLTGFHTDNATRASVFNALGAIVMLASAGRFRLDARAEPLPARRLLAIVLAVTGCLDLLLAVEFRSGWFGIVGSVTAFAVVITLKFVAALFFVILTMERAHGELDRLARTDTLTGIGNRRAFFEATPKRTGIGDTVVLFDADHFKWLNDTWGHDFGDVVLRAMATALAGHADVPTHIARYGGEEFILFLPGAGEAEALRVAERARASVAAIEPEIDGRRVSVTVSAGIAVSHRDGTSLESLIRRADIALYESKGEGGDRSAVHRPDETAPLPPARDVA